MVVTHVTNHVEQQHVAVKHTTHVEQQVVAVKHTNVEVHVE